MKKNSASHATRTKWIVTEMDDDGVPVVIRVRESHPTDREMKDFPVLCVITWPYKSGRSGMPVTKTAARMLEFEEALDLKMEGDVCIQTAARVGNGIREWNFYIGSGEKFLAALNRTLAGRPRFPIEIRFFEEPDWMSYISAIESVRK